MIPKVKEFVKEGIILFEEQLIVRKRIREKSKESHGSLLDAHLLCCATLHNLYSEFLDKVGISNESISARLSLIASFVQGIDICENSISEGLYTQACALIKQELETVAAVNECFKNIRKQKKTPNVNHVKFGLSKHYGMLNGISHVSDRNQFEPLFQCVSEIAEKKPVSILPQYNHTICDLLFSIHVLLVLETTEQLGILFYEMYGHALSEPQQKALISIYQILIEENVLCEEPQTN